MKQKQIRRRREREDRLSATGGQVKGATEKGLEIRKTSGSCFARSDCQVGESASGAQCQVDQDEGKKDG